MSLWDVKDPEAAAAEAEARSQGGKKIIEGAYHAKPVNIKPDTTQSGDKKWVIDWQFVAGETHDQIKESVGGKKKQHYVIGHSKKQVADDYKASMLFTLKTLGVDVGALKSEGGLLDAVEELMQNPPLVCFYVKPQAKDDKYLDWYLKGRVSEDGESVIGKDGIVLNKWGQQGEVAEEKPASAEEAIAKADEGLDF
jgi:hypothetical protein